MLTLSACQVAPPPPAPTLSVQECQRLSRCTLPATAPTTNGELAHALLTVKGAWALCAAKVDMIVDCQAKVQAKIDAETAQTEKGGHD
ncbi:Rz1-like lysis system protein LysC [Paraburkholderia sp. SIMBA_009]|uniref:Rz1-like lysis system protein LysC n=1 Tax=Paraburkholderia TaxID=1822464 RepID=UPI002394A4DE|nr:Rz1-like lysis system protein LysC [Paraburkholderia tropica]